MIHPYEWEEACLMVTVLYAKTNYTFLLDGVDQETFIEHCIKFFGGVINWGIIAIVPISDEVFADLSEKFETAGNGKYVLED